jgi:transposase InsO family protein
MRSAKRWAASGSPGCGGALAHPQRAALEIIHWIEHTYNRRRRQRGLGRLTPVEFELAFANTAAEAA